MRISDWSSDVCSSDLVAHELARLGGVPHDPHLLRRAKATPSLRGRGRRERERIVAGAFALAKDAKARATGRHLILIDDVHARGATLRPAAATSRAGGGARVQAGERRVGEGGCGTVRYGWSP